MHARVYSQNDHQLSPLKSFKHERYLAKSRRSMDSIHATQQTSDAIVKLEELKEKLSSSPSPELRRFHSPTSTPFNFENIIQKAT